MDATVEFATVLKNFQIADSADPYGMLQEFRSIAGQNALENGGNWDLEAKLWHLVQLLSEYRQGPTDAKREVWIIMSWLQTNSPHPQRPLVNGNWTQTQLSNKFASYDADYPLRSGEHIDAKDAQQADEWYKYLYTLLLSGDLELLMEECDLTMKMILSGVKDPLDEQPNQLWKQAVRSLAQNQDLNKYESAIYSYLAGDVATRLDTSEYNWESQLLVHLNHLLQGESQMTLAQVLNIVASMYPEESENPIRVLMGSVILGQFQSIMDSAMELLNDVVNGDDNDLSQTYLLRILTHLAIFMSMFSEIPDKDKLITAYVTVLSLDYPTLIPCYVSFLEDPMESYSFFLTQIEDPEQRSELLSLSTLFGLPMDNIIKRTVQRIFDETEPFYDASTVELNMETDEVDKKMVSAIDWLVLGELYTDAMAAVLIMARRFLLVGKIGSMEYFLKQTNVGTIIKNFELENLEARTEVLELNQYKMLVDTFSKFDLNHVDEIKNTVLTFLSALAQDESFAHKDVVQEIRTLYVPHLVIRLHNLLVATNLKTYTKEALMMANLVADETHKIYLLLQHNGKLKEYLRLVAQSASM